jgi:hypothetical protein
VSDPAGNPLAGAWVYAYDRKGRIIYVLSDDKGIYRKPPAKERKESLPRSAVRMNLPLV